MKIPALIRNIILLGPKHSGKSTIGRELAMLMGSSFVDLDDLIEVRTGKSPRVLYKESPEAFKTAEFLALRSLLSCPSARDDTVVDASGEKRGIPAVIAAGGGVIDNKGARDVLVTTEGLFLVSLETPVETAWARIRAEADRGGELPPFLNTENPVETHRLLHEERTAAYREIAHLNVRAENRASGDMAQEIIKAVFTQLPGTR
jgi:shikimate kinase